MSFIFFHYKLDLLRNFMGSFPLHDGPCDSLLLFNYLVMAWSDGVLSLTTMDSFGILLFDEFTSFVFFVAEYIVMGRD